MLWQYKYCWCSIFGSPFRDKLWLAGDNEYIKSIVLSTITARVNTVLISIPNTSCVCAFARTSKNVTVRSPDNMYSKIVQLMVQ